jgi:hypothetical protein
MNLLYALVAALLIAQTPAGWDDAYRRGERMMLDGRLQEAVALFEGIVKQNPGFDGGHFALGDAYDMMAAKLDPASSAGAPARRRELMLSAAQQYRAAAAGSGPYRPLAVVKLVRLYGPDELNQPADFVAFAREWVRTSPASGVARITLANGLLAQGNEAAATAALLEARAAIDSEGQPLLAASIVEYITKAPRAPASQVKQLLDYAEPILDREAARSPEPRTFLLAKAAALKLRADRVETDPARRRSLLAESDRVFASSRASAPPAVAAPAEAPPATAAEPPSWRAGRDRAEGLVKRKQYAEAAHVYDAFIRTSPAFTPAHYLRLDALIRAGQSAAIEPSLSQARAAMKATPDEQYLAGTYLLDIVVKNTAIAEADARKILAEASAMFDAELKARPHMEGLVYKAVTLKQQARFEHDPAAAKALLAEADRLIAQAQGMRKL